MTNISELSVEGRNEMLLEKTDALNRLVRDLLELHEKVLSFIKPGMQDAEEIKEILDAHQRTHEEINAELRAIAVETKDLISKIRSLPENSQEFFYDDVPEVKVLIDFLDDVLYAVDFAIYEADNLNDLYDALAGLVTTQVPARTPRNGEHITYTVDLYPSTYSGSLILPGQ